MMTEQNLQAIDARVAAITAPGPWSAEIDPTEPDRCQGVYDAEDHAVVQTDSGVYPPDAATAQFIAHAREDVPALVAEVRRLHKQVTEWETLYGLAAGGRPEPDATARGASGARA